MGYIYKITNKLNNMCYIGNSTVHYLARWGEHITTAYNLIYNEYYKKLYKMIRKFGIDNFKIELIEEVIYMKYNILL